MATQQQNRFREEVNRSALIAAKEAPYLIMARRGGYDEGFAAGMRAAQKVYHSDNIFNYADLEEARRRGLEEGRKLNSSNINSVVNESSIRKKAIDDMIENCRVIAESNPNMDAASFLRAVRHRSKKIA